MGGGGGGGGVKGTWQKPITVPELCSLSYLVKYIFILRWTWLSLGFCVPWTDLKDGGHKYALDAITLTADSAASTAAHTGQQGAGKSVRGIIDLNFVTAFKDYSLMLLCVHRDHKTSRDGDPRTATSTFTQFLSSVLSSPSHFSPFNYCLGVL